MVDENKKDFLSPRMPNNEIIFVSNKQDEEMYNEWYGFLDWHKTNINFLEYKLQNGENFDKDGILDFFHKNIIRSGQCFCVRRNSYDYDFYINEHEIFFNFLSYIKKMDVYTIDIGAITPWEKLPGTYDREDRNTIADSLYEEMIDWLDKNIDKDFDMSDYPYHHDAIENDTYKRTMLIISIRTDFVKEFYFKFYDRVKKCEEKMTSKNIHHRWYRGKFIWCRITKPNLETIPYDGEIVIVTF